MHDTLLFERHGAVGQPPPDLVRPVLEELVAKLGFERALVAAVEPNPPSLSGIASANISDQLAETFRIGLTENPTVILSAMEEGKPVLVADVVRDGRISEEVRAMCVQFGMYCLAVVPLIPASSILLVSKEHPITDAEVSDLLPYAGRLIAVLAERGVARPESEERAVEGEWLWWMVNTVQDPVLLTDERNDLVLMNTQASRLFQIGSEDSLGKRRAIELNNFLLSATLSSIALAGGPEPGRDLSLVDPIEGGELLYEVICHPATNLRTGDQGMISLLKDVSDLRRAGEQLSRSLEGLRATGEEVQFERDRLSLILTNVADPIVVTNAAGEITLMNAPAERLLPATSDTHVGGWRTIHLANEAKLSSFLVPLKLTPDRMRYGEIQMVDPDTGEVLTMGTTATAVRDELGELSSAVCVLHDLTKIRELEQRRVEQQLFESEKQAAVGRLAATLAHEINNPLEAIKNSLELLESHAGESDVAATIRSARFLGIARKETDRLSGIIRQVLGFYRQTVVAEPTQVNRVLEEAIELLERQLRQSGVTVHSDLAADLPLVPTPADQLKQVVLNLLINAQDAMPKGGTVHVTTRLSRETDTEFLAGRYVLIQVRDTGSGISEEDLPFIFDPFFSTKRETKGTGLGLWVSQTIAQDHGGQIKVQSRQGRGTTFTVALPPVAA